MWRCRFGTARLQVPECPSLAIISKIPARYFVCVMVISMFSVRAGICALALTGACVALSISAKADDNFNAPFSWTGFYVGANVGYGRGSGDPVGWSSEDFDNGAAGSVFLNLAFANSLSAARANYSQSNSIDGYFGGGQAGYNWQLSPGGLVVGLETDIQWSGIDGSATTTGTFPLLNRPNEPLVVNATSMQGLNWFGTLRGRIGVPIGGDRFMPFVSGGLAYGETDSSATVTTRGITTVNAASTQLRCPLPAGCTLNGSDTKTSVGWSAGGGMEWALPGNATFKFEFLHIDLGSQTLTLVPTNGTIGNGYARAKFDNTYDVVRVGVNYRF